jgi:hypothetical protein
MEISIDYDDIKQIFKNHSRSSRKKGINSRGMVPQSSNPTTHIKNELGGLIEDMKTDIFILYPCKWILCRSRRNMRKYLVPALPLKIAQTTIGVDPCSYAQTKVQFMDQ